jgi:hypothetical protein
MEIITNENPVHRAGFFVFIISHLIIALDGYPIKKIL